MSSFQTIKSGLITLYLICHAPPLRCWLSIGENVNFVISTAKLQHFLQICKFYAGKENLFLMCGTVMALIKVQNSAFIVRLLSVYCAWIVRVLCVIDKVHQENIIKEINGFNNFLTISSYLYNIVVVLLHRIWKNDVRIYNSFSPKGLEKSYKSYYAEHHSLQGTP